LQLGCGEGRSEERPLLCVPGMFDSSEVEVL